jgi:hypothetical protein
MSLREAAFMWFYIMLALGTVYWIHSAIKENYGQTMYWRGRKHGFDMHRRITDAKRDQVFDYDKN